MRNPFKAILQSSLARGGKIIAVSLLVALLLLAPLLLYLMFGPADGNPIGLGLLALLGQLIGFVGCLVGLVVLWRDMGRK